MSVTTTLWNSITLAPTLAHIPQTSQNSSVFSFLYSHCTQPILTDYTPRSAMVAK